MSAAALKPYDVVTSADGVIYAVRYVDGKSGTAHVYPFAGALEDTIELPVAELRRVPDPRNRRPPVEGIPDGPRPRCATCGDLIRFFTNDTRQYADRTKPRITRRVFAGWRGYGRGADGVPVFDTLDCARAFAVAAYRAGYRIKPAPTRGK